MSSKNHKLTRRNADKYKLYLASVQEPEVETAFFNKVYRKRFGCPPLSLREDFCGTAAICVDWVRSRADRIAVGVDLDPQPLAWCTEHLLPSLTAAQRARLKLLEQDVRTTGSQKFHIVSAQNFSFFLFKTRDSLREYFEYALSNLADQGLLVADMMGGSECMLEDRMDKRKKDGFTYLWEQKRFDPITHDTHFAIHFKFPDGSQWKDAFTYDWRLWTMPEVRELLREAGFSKVDVYWEGTDENNEGDGNFKIRKHVPADPAWIAYIVAQK